MTTEASDTEHDLIKKSVSSALNEQGYLYSQVVREKVSNRLSGDTQESWKVVASEYPVTAADGSQTRIDHVLERGCCYLIFECKRSNPNYKRWVFFDPVDDKTPLDHRIHLETARCYGRSADTIHNPLHSIHQIGVPKNFRLFNYYLEVALRRQNQQWSATNTIEDSFHQVIRGQSGLLTKILTYPDTGMARVIPVVVTTAEMYAADFSAEAISLREGTIADSSLSLSPLDFCGVNFHPNNNLSVQSTWSKTKPASIRDDLIGCQRRTVFVVQTSAINHFLTWAEHHLTEIR